jgi:hypothetical protein
MKSKPIKKELIFIHHTNIDPRMKVMALIDNTTNYIIPEDLLDTNILYAIGLTQDDLKLCADFFKAV